jgi:hypothetical protein
MAIIPAALDRCILKDRLKDEMGAMLSTTFHKYDNVSFSLEEAKGNSPARIGTADPRAGFRFSPELSSAGATPPVPALQASFHFSNFSTP